MADVLDVQESNEFPMDAETEEDTLKRLKERATKRKGRGFGAETRSGITQFEALERDAGDGEAAHGGDDSLKPQRSIEGWILFVTNVHEEATEDNLTDKFGEFGEVRNMHMNLDRRSGFLKGYVLVEYATFREAESALRSLNGADLLGQALEVSWCFVRGAANSERQAGGGRRAKRSSSANRRSDASNRQPASSRRSRTRSRSPVRR